MHVFLLDPDDTTFSPTLLRMLRVLRLVRMTRLFKSTQIGLPMFRKALHKLVNQWIWMGYDIGKGYMVAQDEVWQSEIILYCANMTSALSGIVTSAPLKLWSLNDANNLPTEFSCDRSVACWTKLWMMTQSKLKFRERAKKGNFMGVYNEFHNDL